MTTSIDFIARAGNASLPLSVKSEMEALLQQTASRPQDPQEKSLDYPISSYNDSPLSTTSQSPDDLPPFSVFLDKAEEPTSETMPSSRDASSSPSSPPSEQTRLLDRLAETIGRTPNVFGSMFTGLCDLEESFATDIDVSFSYAFDDFVSTGDPRDLQLRACSQIVEKLRSSSKAGSAKYTDIEPILCAVCPIVKCVDALSSRRIDISVNNENALRNSALLKKYADNYKVVRPLVLQVKTWTKKEGLVMDNRNGRSYV